MLELYDPPPVMPAVIELDFYAYYDDGSSVRFGTNMSHDGGFGLYIEDGGTSTPVEVDGGYLVTWGEVIEFGIVVEQLNNPQRLEVVFVNYWTDTGGGMEGVDIMEP